ncbi:MAG: cytochrome c oxidase accessory protein CcoG [Bacteroidia bacterium]
MVLKSTDELYKDEEEFRDHLANVDKKGKRLWIYAKKPKGKLYNYRSRFSWFLMALMFSGPFIKLNGKPLLMLNVLERKFIIFGMVFWPQDLNIFALLMLTFIIFIVLFTVVFGRVWCGWACPQTIFMEMLFRKIEYLIEGDASAQRKLDKQEWNTEKIIKKTAKHLVFWILSFIIANTFLAYIISWDELKLMISEGPAAHLGKLIALSIFTTVFYFVFAKLRDLVCIFICPYGRLQGLMLDKDSIVVAYDFIRGEPRGRLKKEEEHTNKGDCIDCHLCVQVCPTGIDIRNGTQLECINCTACIDACDDVMTKINKPKGLIRFASLNGITKGEKLRLTPRNVAYSVVLVILLSVLVTLLATRKQVETTVLRTPGMLYQEQGENISNLYNIEFVNKTFKELPIQLELVDVKGEIKLVQQEGITVHKEDVAKTSFFVLMDRQEIKKASTPIKIRVKSNDKVIEEVKTKFMGPVYKP